MTYNIRMKKLYHDVAAKKRKTHRIWLSRSNSDPTDYINPQMQGDTQNEKMLQLDVSVIGKKKETQKITEEELSFISNDEMLENM